MKKMPVRTCVVCHSKIEKKNLLRIVCNKDNEIFYDPTGKANGRGAYICDDPKCLDAFLKKLLNGQSTKIPSKKCVKK